MTLQGVYLCGEEGSQEISIFFAAKLLGREIVRDALEKHYKTVAFEDDYLIWFKWA